MAKKRKNSRSKAGLISALARKRNLDPQAVLSVARGEGGIEDRPGLADIGDLAGGGSYGPFQLYAQGALPAQYRGKRAAADRWAWSPEGIAYALDQMVKVGAGGLRGPQAIRTIISKFERPADPTTSIRNALSRYGEGGVSAAPSFPSLQPGTIAEAPNPAYRDARRAALRQAIGSGGSFVDAFTGINVPRTISRPTQMPQPQLSPASPMGEGGFSPTELFYDPLGGYDNGQKIAAIGGHSDHVHAAFANAQQTLRAIRLAQALGLRVSENPYVDRVDPVHTKGSFHYQTFPGTNVGRAIDVSGNPQKMATLYRRLAPRR